MADKDGRDYESTTEDPYPLKLRRVKRLLANPSHHELSNRKLAVLARVSEKMIRKYRKEMGLPTLAPHSGKLVKRKPPDAGRRRGS